MAIDLGKASNELTKQEPLQEGYYMARITKVQEGVPNKAQRDGGPDAEGAGLNVILDMKLEDDDPLTNGRSFRKYLVLPRPGDESTPGWRYQTLEDERIADILECLAAFEGCDMQDLDPSAITFRVGTRAMIPIQTGIHIVTGEPTSEVAMNLKFRPVE